MVLLETAQGLRLFHGVQVLAEQVFHQGDLLMVLSVDKNGGDGDEAGLTRCAATPVPCNNVVLAVFHPKENGFQHAVLGDGGRQFIKRRRFNEFSGLVWFGQECLIGDGFTLPR